MEIREKVNIDLTLKQLCGCRFSSLFPSAWLFIVLDNISLFLLLFKMSLLFVRHWKP